jgi:hypothetical protein
VKKENSIYKGNILHVPVNRYYLRQLNHTECIAATVKQSIITVKDRALNLH